MYFTRMALFLLALVFSMHPIFAQTQPQPSNGDFENWTDTTYHHFLDGYNLNLFYAILEGGANKATVVKVPGKNNQGSAVRLQNAEGYLGQVQTGIVYNTHPYSFNNGGEPFGEQPTAVNIVTNYDLKAGDTAQIYFRFKKDSTIPLLINLTGSSGGYTTIHRPVSLPFAPDTVKLIMSSALINYGGKSAQSWMDVDSIYFGGTSSQLTNNGFNQWTKVGTFDPDNWDTPNMLLNLKHIDTLLYAATRTTDAVNGNYALKITTDQTSTDFPNDNISTGFVVNGHFNGNTGEFKGVPFTAKPEKLTFYYKNAPAGNDTAIAAVLFSKYINGTDSIIAGRTVKLPVKNSYQKEVLEINWQFASMDPDSVAIVFSPGNLIASPNLEFGSTMWVDNVMFEYPSGIKTEVPGKNDLATIYPNPAGSFLYFKLKDGVNHSTAHVEILDVNGKVIRQFQIGNRYSMDLSGLSAGTYIYEVTAGKRSQTGRFIVE